MRLAQATEGMAATKKTAEESAANAQAPELTGDVGADGVGDKESAAAASAIEAKGETAPVVAGGAGPVAGLRRLKAEELDASQRWWLLESAKVRNLTEMAADLRAAGVKISQPTLSRLLWKLRQMAVVQSGEELAVTARELAAQGKRSNLREGALEAVRQKVFQRALVAETPKAVMEMYGALAKEEEKLRRVAVEEEKARQNGEALELQRQRLQMQAAASGVGWFLESVKVLSEEGLKAEEKLKLVMAEVDRWKAGAIEVRSGGGKLLAEKAGLAKGGS